MKSTPDRFRVRGTSVHLFVGTTALIAALVSPLFDLANLQLGNYSIMITGILLGIALLLGFRDLLLARFNVQRKEFLIAHVVFGFSMLLILGYTVTRWQADIDSSLAFSVDLVIALFSAVGWWLGRKAAHRSALASLLPRRTKS